MPDSAVMPIVRVAVLAVSTAGALFLLVNAAVG